MPSRLLPLFPLQAVVFPRTEIPLHIFEERYKEMVSEAIRDESEFGIVLAKDDGIVNAGCSVLVEKVTHKYPDGRLDIIVRGQRRFEVVLLNEEKSYLRGEVDFFDDEEAAPAPSDLRQKAVSQFPSLVEIGEAKPGPEPEINDPQLSFQLAQSLQDVDFLSLLLRTRSETERLKELNEYLSQYLPKQRQILRMRDLAPRNGYGGKVAGL